MVLLAGRQVREAFHGSVRSAGWRKMRGVWRIWEEGETWRRGGAFQDDESLPVVPGPQREGRGITIGPRGQRCGHSRESGRLRCSIHYGSSSPFTPLPIQLHGNVLGEAVEDGPEAAPRTPVGTPEEALGVVSALAAIREVKQQMREFSPSLPL